MIRLFDGRVLVRPEVVSDKTPGGIALPASTQDRTFFVRGTVVSRGVKPDGVLLTFESGDTVLYDVRSAAEIDYEGEKLRLLKYEDIIGIIT